MDCFHLTSALRPSPRRWVFANSIRKILTYFPSTYVYLRLFRDGSSILTAAACGVAGRASPLHMFYSTDTLVCCIFVFCILSGIKFRNLRSVSGDCWRTSWLAGWLCAPPYWLAPRPCRHPCRRPLSCPLPHVSPLRLQPEHHTRLKLPAAFNRDSKPGLQSRSTSSLLVPLRCPVHKGRCEKRYCARANAVGVTVKGLGRRSVS